MVEWMDRWVDNYVGGTPPAIQKGGSTVIMMVHNVYTEKLLHTANEHFFH